MRQAAPDLSEWAALDDEERRRRLARLTPAQRDQLDAILAGAPLRLRDYIRLMWHVVEPETRFVGGFHVDAICEHLTAVSDGQIRRLLITVPPRHTKSLCTSVGWPTWTWTRSASRRFMFASYSSHLSTEHAVLSRRVIDSEWYQARWGDRFQLTTDQNIKTHFENTARGFRISTSVGGSVIGRGADVLVVDDPHSIEDAHSDEVREGVLRWYRQSWYTRQNDPKRSSMVVIMQRVHEKDLAGDLLSTGEYEHLNLPTEYEGDRRKTVIGWADPRTEAGELLCPERFGPDQVREAKRTLGTYGYVSQHQQRPSPPKGGIFNRDWWRFYDERPARFDELIQSWDTTFKDVDTADFCVGQVWGRIGKKFYLLDQVKDQMSFVRALVEIKLLTAKWPEAVRKLVEDSANGPAIVNTLETTIGGIELVSPEGSKVARAFSISPLIEDGDVYLPDPSICPWIGDYIDSFAKFPKGDHDDDVDATTQALRYFSKHVALEIW